MAEDERFPTYDQLFEGWKQMQAERDRLRAALQQIADEPRQPMGDGRKWAYKLHGIAVTALAGSPVETNCMRVAGPEASGEATGPEGDDSNMGTAPTSGPEATSSQGNAERTTPPRLYEHENYCNEHGGHLRDSPACYLARERETDDDGCSACGHATRYHFDDGAGNVVCRASSDCECCHRAESIPAVETAAKPPLDTDDIERLAREHFCEVHGIPPVDQWPMMPEEVKESYRQWIRNKQAELASEKAAAEPTAK